MNVTCMHVSLRPPSTDMIQAKEREECGWRFMKLDCNLCLRGRYFSFDAPLAFLPVRYD